MKKTKSHRLDFKPELEFSLLGISSHENDYYLSWAINHNIGLKLKRVKTLSVFSKHLDADQDFSVYSYEDHEAVILYNLVSNSGENGFLFPELRNIDFFLQIYGEISENFLEDIISKLKKIDIISTCFHLELKNLKSPDKLLFN